MCKLSADTPDEHSHRYNADVLSHRFVTLDTDSREDMMRVMMHVRTQTLRDQCVQARLKASSTASFETAPPMPIWPDFTEADMAEKSASKNKKKKQRNKKSKKKNSSKQQQQPKRQTSMKPSPPSMGEDDFPTLQDKKVEWDTMPVERENEKAIGGIEDEEEEEDEDTRRSSNKSLSDGASTATTTSSSLDSTSRKTLGGYAAALRKAPAPTTITETSPVVTPKRSQSATTLSSSMTSPAKAPKVKVTAPATEEAPPAPVVIAPPSWGGGRSFADILRD